MVSYLKRVYSVAEIRTGFVASSSLLLGIGYGIYTTDTIYPILSILLFISAFAFNIVANIAAEISGYLKQEDTNHQTGHSGSEGLVRGEASLFDAWSSLILFSLIAIGGGLIVTCISHTWTLIVLGAIGFFVAIFYSLTPLAFNKYPVSEFVSGLMCGSFAFIAGSLIYMNISVNMVLFSLMPMIMVAFLMAANNTTDYNKDMGVRTTVAHILGFERSITILKPFIIILFAIWIYICSFELHSLVLLLIGLLVLVYFGLYKWYIPYSKATQDMEELSRVYGPLPLALLLPFNFIISIMLIILR